MNPRRFATVVAALCGTVVLAGWVVAWLAGFGSAGIENTGAVQDRRAPSLTADAELVDAPQATAMGNAAVANDDVATAAKSVTGPATDTTAARMSRNRSSKPRCPIRRRCCRPNHRPCRWRQRARLIRCQTTPGRL